MVVAQNGANLALIDIHEGRLTETVQKLKSEGVSSRRILTKIGDVTKADEIKEFVDEIGQKFGQINVLVNVVGAKRIKVLKNMTEADFDWCLNGNVRSTFLMTQTCLPLLTESKGNVVNITSVSGQRPVWGALPYAMAKAAVDQFTRCTSQGKKNVTGPDSKNHAILDHSGKDLSNMLNCEP